MPQPSLTIMRHDLIGAPHWYVIDADGKTMHHKKFNHLEDAKRYAETLTSPENIEVWD